ncbi:MAG: VOC family protein [Gemmatimonadales bacterium]
MSADTNPPPIHHVLETAVYCDDLATCAAFYKDVLGLETFHESDRAVLLDAGGATVLLLFKRGASADGADTTSGRIPGHDGSGNTHFALAIAADDYEAWERHLTDSGITIESRVTWSRGGRSLYFRDPEGHSVELVTPGTWPTY